MPDVLNLSDANLTGFDAIPAGKYDALVWEVAEVTVENPDGKLPLGTPGYNVQFKVDGGEYDGRRFFSRFYIPTSEDYDAEKAKTMKGMFARFLMAIGYSEKEVTGGKFKVDIEDWKGRPCTITLNKKPYEGEDRNNVTAVRPRGQNAEESGLL